MIPRRRSAGLLAGLVLGALVLTGCGGASSPQIAVDLSGTVVDPPWTPGSGALVTTDGKPFSLTRDTTAPLTLVFFGYTHCPDICPAVLSSVASGLTKLTAAQRKQVQLYFVSTDPKRDTGPVLEEYVHHFDSSFKALTGDLRTISAVAKSVGIFVDPGDPLSSVYDPNSHSSYVVGVNARHQAPIFWSGDTAPSQFAGDIRFLLTKKPAHLTSQTH